jgi:hypothetical protein
MAMRGADTASLPALRWRWAAATARLRSLRRVLFDPLSASAMEMRAKLRILCLDAVITDVSVRVAGYEADVCDDDEPSSPPPTDWPAERPQFESAVENCVNERTVRRSRRGGQKHKKGC